MPIIDNIESVYNNEVEKPSAWFRAVQRGENVSSSMMWYIDKERIYDEYNQKYIRSFDTNDNETITNDYIERPKHSDYMRVMSEQVLVLPNGKVITPIRQFCEVKVLPVDVREALFYSVGTLKYTPDDDIQTPTTANIKITRMETRSRDTPITIEYIDTGTTPSNIIKATNKAFALESINDENSIVYDVVKKNRDVKTVIGGVRGLYETILQAKGKLEDEGLDCNNLVMYTSGKIIRDLTLDADLDSYIGFSRPAIITEATIERILGINLVRNSNATETKTKIINIDEGFWSKLKRIILRRKKPTREEKYNVTTSILFIPNIAFGLVVGKNITMEAQRRNEIQAIRVNGTQRSAAVVKVPEACIKIINSE